MSRITKAIERWEKGHLAIGAFCIELVRNLVPEEIPELLELTPPDVLEKLKEDACCGKRLQVMWAGAWVGGNPQEAWDRETEVFNNGLAVLRDGLGAKGKALG